VRGLHLDKLNQTLIKSITEVAHLLDKKTVAEFVEDQATFDILKSIGVDYIQGHFLGKASPSPTSELNTAAP
jgi:EAL domain-containing protein (putative c-di-GMP-specific phosphodiesterase class I)